MKFKKVIINGQTLYQPIEDEEVDDEKYQDKLKRAKEKLANKKIKYASKKLPQEISINIADIIEQAIQSLDADLDEDDIEDIVEDATEEASDIYEEYVDSLDDDDDDDDDDEDEDDEDSEDWLCFKNGKQSFYSKSNHSSKIYQMLPFMSRADIHELVERILSGDEDVKQISIYALLPFMNQEDCEALFIESLRANNKKVNPVAVAPFVSRECLTKVVDKYIAGEYPDLRVEGLYPFLSSYDIKRLFKYITEEEKKNKKDK